MKIVIAFLLCLLLISSSRTDSCSGQELEIEKATLESLGLSEFFSNYCIECHGTEDGSGDLLLESILDKPLTENSVTLEKAVRQLRARRMPPIDAQRPGEATYQRVISVLKTALDQVAESNPNPGRTETFRRLNRTEYQNAIRDLLHLEIDTSEMLPKDQESHGFDNVTVGNLSPTLLDRYITAAQKISKIAVGRAAGSPEGTTIRIQPDVTQEEHVDGLPLGTRGGALFRHTFPSAGEYQIEIMLARDRNETVEGLHGEHQLELLLDRALIDSFKVKRPDDGVSFTDVDKHLKTKIKVTAGAHNLGVTFVKKRSSLIETERQPYQAHFNFHRHPRLSPAVYQVSITGPIKSAEVETDDLDGLSSARRQIFSPAAMELPHEDDRAKAILQRLTRLAYRRPVTEQDLATPLKFFRQAREEADFDAGIEMAISSILVNPNFLFRIEKDPPKVDSKTAYQISDIDLASRLSFFLWSSIPDNELLELAESGRLSQPGEIEKQVQRMLADDRSSSLVKNFAAQWLYLRNLDSFTPNSRLFPDFDNNLRQSLRTETELFFESVMREDRSVLDLLKSDYTFLNERLAKHYGIPHVFGSHFRRVEFDDRSERGGLLRHGSILTVTSYATRTSPVIRGNWGFGKHHWCSDSTSAGRCFFA